MTRDFCERCRAQRPVRRDSFHQAAAIDHPVPVFRYDLREIVASLCRGTCAGTCAARSENGGGIVTSFRRELIDAKNGGA
jgi:hypothetical protein